MLLSSFSHPSDQIPLATSTLRDMWTSCCRWHLIRGRLHNSTCRRSWQTIRRSGYILLRSARGGHRGIRLSSKPSEDWGATAYNTCWWDEWCKICSWQFLWIREVIVCIITYIPHHNNNSWVIITSTSNFQQQITENYAQNNRTWYVMYFKQSTGWAQPNQNAWIS